MTVYVDVADARVKVGRRIIFTETVIHRTGTHCMHTHFVSPDLASRLLAYGQASEMCISMLIARSERCNKAVVCL